MKNLLMGRKAHEFFPSTADVIQIKRTGERLRAFYATNQNHRYTLKIVRDSDRHKFIEAAKREVAAREQLAALNTINIPKVLGTEQRKNAFLLFEEMVLGRRFNARAHRTLYRTELLPQLRDTYQAYGVRYAPIQTFLPPDKSQKVLNLLAERADGERFVKALQNVIERNGLVAVSLCHGGLLACNLVVASGTVIFLDWKWANEGMILLDLLQMATKYERLPYMIENIREIVTSNFMDNSCRFEEMLTAGIALETLRTPRSVAKLMRIWQRHALQRPTE